MSLKSTKEQLIRLLDDEDNKVIALSGKWGTGKSFMWDEVKKASEDEKVKNALYASLFGLSTMEQIKMKLIQSAMPALEANPGSLDVAKQMFSSSVKVLQGFHRGFNALNDIGLIIAPAMLRQKVIVLDDIERKHEKLNIDEVLGFIDEFIRQHGSRFVLILNSDQLHKREVWDTLREKVVDQELRLSTSAAEAFEIAIGLSPSLYAEQIKVNVEVCGLTNIRIIRRVIKAVNCILREHQDLTDAVLSRVIPSIVLLAAIHYKGIEDGPDFDFVLAQGTDRDWSLFHDKKEVETEESKRKSKWKLLMTSLGIQICDDFELLVVEFLQSGLLDITKVSENIDRYVAKTDEMNARDAYNKFFERSVWDHTLTDEQLLAQATEVAAKAELLGPYEVTALYETIMELPNGQPVADAAVARWISAFRDKNLQEAVFDNFFRRKIHPLIEAEFNAINTQTQINTSVFDACIAVTRNGEWGPRQEIALKSATVQDMESTIRNCAPQDLKLFMSGMLELCIHKSSNEHNFGSAMDHFIEACRNIADDPDSGRLGKLVKYLFDNAKLSMLLDPSLAAVENEP